MCYDEDEDDPWQYLTALQQDCFTDEMKPPRKKTAEYIMNNVSENAAWNFIAIDPCLSLLLRKQEKVDLLKTSPCLPRPKFTSASYHPITTIP